MRFSFIFSVVMAWALCAGAPIARAGQVVEVRQLGNTIEVAVGGQPFAIYHFDPAVAKPFFMPLRSAQGVIITRGYPQGNEVPPAHQHEADLEPHQRSIYFAHGNIDGIDFWGEAAFPKWSGDSVFGRTKLQKIEEARGGQESGVLRALFNLLSPRGRVIAQERQSFVFRGEEDSRTVDCAIEILADQGAPVTMGDTKEGTFAIRLIKELNAPPARMISSAGGQDEKEIWGKRADWVDYSGRVDGRVVGVALFDHPKSFRHPTYWHARGYGLFSANPFALREFTRDPDQDGNWTIEQGKSLKFRYRVFIHNGDAAQAHVAEAYRAYAASP